MSDYKSSLEKALTTLWEREKEYGEALDASATAEHAYKLRMAQEYLNANGTIDERKAHAVVACENLHLAYLKADAVKSFTKEKLRDVQDSVSARQSLLSYSAKTDFGYANNREIT